MSKRSSFRPFFPVVRGPIAIAVGGYFNTKLRRLRKGKPMPTIQRRVAKEQAIWASSRDKWLCVFNFKPVGATGTAFFDLTTPPEAASCRAWQ
jgi:hypothetical protein